MKKYYLIISIFVSISLYVSADSVPRVIRVTDIVSSSEIELLKKGRILSYARMDGKGEVFTGGAAPSFPRGAGSMYDYPSGYSIAAVEKVFFKGENGQSGIIFDKIKDYNALKGMKYYSLSEGRAMPLILESFQSGNSTVNYNGVSGSVISCFTIKDNRLGAIPLRSEAWIDNGAVYASGICSGSVTRFGMKIFEPGDYRIYKFFIYDKTAGGWFYCSVQLMRVRSDIMKSIDLLKPENICNRLRGDTVHMLGLLGYDRRGELAAFR